MLKVLQSIYDIDILYVSRKGGGRGLSIKVHCVDAEIQRLGECIKIDEKKTNCNSQQWESKIKQKKKQ